MMLTANAPFAEMQLFKFSDQIVSQHNGIDHKSRTT